MKLPDNMMSGLDAITVSTEVWVDPAQSGNYFVWNLGNTGTDGVGNGYLFATGNSTYRAAIASGNWTTEQGMTSGSALARGAWKTLTYTLGDGVSTLYLDGRQVARNANVTLKPGDIGDGVTTANYIGRSAYNGDNRLRGKVRDFRLYSRALSGAEVAELAAAPTDVLGVELDSLKVPAMIDATAGTITLPVEPGTDLTTLDPTYAVVSGATVSPDGPADYTSPVALTVTNGADSRVWTVTAVEMRSPVLPGLYADPNIAVFDGTYYIYATTDGTPGWGGKDFYVWSSPDLVTWTRSEEPFLTLDGANGNVPWASGNAWAPTIIERGGKYYFYFSGHNAALNRKTIGVAVADSPTGPFTAQPQAMILNNEAVTSGQAIDPAAFHDPVSGKYYLYWGNGSPGDGRARRRHGVAQAGHDRADDRPDGLPRGLVHELPRRDLPPHLRDRRHRFAELPRRLRHRHQPHRAVDLPRRDPGEGRLAGHPRHRPQLDRAGAGHRRVVHRLPPLRHPRRRRDAPGDHDRPAHLRCGRPDPEGRADAVVGRRAGLHRRPGRRRPCPTRVVPVGTAPTPR